MLVRDKDSWHRWRTTLNRTLSTLQLTNGESVWDCVCVRTHWTRVLKWMFIMVTLCNRADHYIFALWFLSFYRLLSFYSSPNLSGRRWDVYHTLTHGVALVRIYNVGLKYVHAARCKYRTQKWCKKSLSGHHRTTLSGYIFATKPCINNRKKTH